MTIDEQIADAAEDALERVADRVLAPLIRNLLDDTLPQKLVLNSREAAHALGCSLDGLRDHEARGLRVIPGTEHSKRFRIGEIQRHLDTIAPIEATALRSVS